MKLETGQYYWFQPNNEKGWRIGRVIEDEEHHQWLRILGRKADIDLATLDFSCCSWAYAESPNGRRLVGTVELCCGETLMLMRDDAEMEQAAAAAADPDDGEDRARMEAAVDLFSGSLSHRQTWWLAIAALGRLRTRMAEKGHPDLESVDEALGLLDTETQGLTPSP